MIPGTLSYSSQMRVLLSGGGCKAQACFCLSDNMGPLAFIGTPHLLLTLFVPGLLQISRQSIDALKDWFRDEMQKSDWQLIVELKKVFEII